MANENNPLSELEVSVYENGKKIRFKSGTDISGKINIHVQPPSNDKDSLNVELTFE